MFKNYIKTAWRNIWKNKLHSFINIAGLSVAFSICILLFLVCYFQFSYDSFHSDEDRLFRISLFSNTPNGEQLSTQMPFPLKDALVNDIPDIDNAVIVNMGRRENITYKDKHLERVVLRTDPDFFEIFNFPIIDGYKAAPLGDIQDIALSEGTAKALFGDVNPVGKEIQIGRSGEQKYFTVAALIKDCPKNSSISFDAVARIESHFNYAGLKDNWEAGSSNIFIKIAQNSSGKITEQKLKAIVEDHYSARLEQLKSEHSKSFENQDLLSMRLTRMEDVHFSGDRSTPLALVYAILGLGAFILLIACINFVNLNMAMAFKRSRALGIRKTFGAFRGQLFLQMWGEAFLLYLTGLFLGVLISVQLIGIFNAQFDARIQIATLMEPGFIAIILGVFLIVTLIAGGFPAMKMANFNLVEILKGNISTKKPGALRNSLLIGQFAISSLLISVSWIASRQLDYLREKPIGFDKEQVVSIPVGEFQDGRKILSRLRNTFSGDADILSLTGAGSNLGRGRDRTTSRTTVGIDYNQTHLEADWLLTDTDYLKTLGIPILRGRDFNPNIAADSINAIVVTESFAKAMGETDPVGKYIGGDENTTGNQIIGVVPDFNAYSPSELSLPIAMHVSPREALSYIFVKVKSQDPQAIIKKLETEWEKASGNAAFNASYLNENLQAWYEQELILTTVFGLASAIAIFLSCLGLFAISLLVIESRTKEIGIRKVMGASVNGIVGMISLHFLKLVLVSLLIALPVAWYAMQQWLENYSYRININPLTFIGVGLLVVSIALITVGYHSIKASLVNPVKSLRTE